MYKFIIPNTKEYKGKVVLPLRVRWRHNSKKLEFNTDLRVERKLWDSKREKPLAKAGASVLSAFNELELKAESIWIRLETGSIQLSEVKNLWASGNLNVKSVDDFLDNYLKHLKPSTFRSRKNAIQSYKKHFYGESKKPLLISDITPYNCKLVADNMKAKSLSQETINTCIKGVKATYNDMHRKGVEGIKENLKLDRGIIRKVRPSIPEIIKDREYLLGVNKIRTVNDWEAFAIGFLMLGLRGLDLIDLIKVTDKNFIGVDKNRDLSNVFWDCYNKQSGCELFLKITRSKVPDGQPMRINLTLDNGIFILPIFQLLAISLREKGNSIDAFLNDRHLSNLSLKFNFEDYRALSMSYGKKHKKLTGYPFKTIRKTFRTLASVYCNVSTEIGNALLGQENLNISSSYLYIDSLQTEIDKVHNEVLSKFGFEDLFYSLIKKAKDVGIDKDELILHQYPMLNNYASD